MVIPWLAGLDWLLTRGCSQLRKVWEMVRKKKDDLQTVVDSLLTIEEACQWIEQHQDELGLSASVNRDTLKKACQSGRLKAVIKGHTFLTREEELREYLGKFDPKNKRGSRPLQPRAIKKREQQMESKTE